jgi:hypothetical protein
MHDWLYLVGGIAFAIGINVLAFKAGWWLILLVGWVRLAWQERARRRPHAHTGRTLMQADTMTSIAEHLEFLGYRCEAQDDGWTFAAHPARPDVFVRVFPFGLRIVALFDLGPLDEAACGQWVWFANRCNDAGLLVKFALAAREGGGRLLRASAVCQGGYDRVAFGAFMDMWHHDLGLMSHAPGGETSGEAEEDEEERIAGAKAEVTH